MGARDEETPAAQKQKPSVLLAVLLLGSAAAVAGIAITVLWNWFFRGEFVLTGDDVARLVILGFVVGTMPLGLMWARSRKEKPS